MPWLLCWWADPSETKQRPQNLCFLPFKTELHTKNVLKRKNCKLHLGDIEMKYFDFLKMKDFGVFGLFASCFPAVEIFFHFFSMFAHSLPKSSAVLVLIAYLLSPRSICIGVCILALCVSTLYALSGRDWIGTEDKDFNLRWLKRRNKWKSMESNCKIWTMKGVVVTQVACKWLKSPMNKMRCCFCTFSQMANHSLAFFYLISCCRMAGICQEQILQPRLGMRHQLLVHTVDLPVGTRRCLFVCPFPAPSRRSPIHLLTMW